MYVCGIAVCTYAERDRRKEVCTYVERDCRKEVHTESVVALSNSEGQTAGGTRERAGRVGVTKNAEKFSWNIYRGTATTQLNVLALQ